MEHIVNAAIVCFFLGAAVLFIYPLFAMYSWGWLTLVWLPVNWAASGLLVCLFMMACVFAEDNF